MAKYKNEIRCSFCGKTQDEVRKLIAGPDGVFICNDCVDICIGIIEEELTSFVDVNEQMYIVPEMLEIVSFPLASAEDPSGREYVFLPAVLDIIQNYALDSMENDINAYTGLPNYTMNITKS